MSNIINVSNNQIDGIDFTFITQEGSDLIRTSVALPFDSSKMIDKTYAFETPHLLEHLACGGDISTERAEYVELMESYGGYINAYTSPYINGLLLFETVQPAVARSLSRELVSSVFFPKIDSTHTVEQKRIVARELEGNLQNPVRQREMLMQYTHGDIFKTDKMGLNSLSDISINSLAALHKETFSKNNARVVLAGSPRATESVAEDICNILRDVPEVERLYSSSNKPTRKADYYAGALEIPEGTTNYGYTAVQDIEEVGELTTAGCSVILGAFRSYLNDGEGGINMQSRSRGLSYGLNARVFKTQSRTAISMSDTVRTNDVRSQVELLGERLDQFTEFTTSDFEVYRNKQLGRLMIYQQDLLSIATLVEGTIASKEANEVITNTEFIDELTTIDPKYVVESVHRIAAMMRDPLFVNKYSFGSNPFNG